MQVHKNTVVGIHYTISVDNEGEVFSNLDYDPEEYVHGAISIFPMVAKALEGHEVNDTVQAMLAMTLDELKEVWNDPKATILEKTIANAMRKSLEKGSLYSIETLLSRVYGKPKETADVNQNVTGEIKISLDLGE